MTRERSDRHRTAHSITHRDRGTATLVAVRDRQVVRRVPVHVDATVDLVGVEGALAEARDVIPIWITGHSAGNIRSRTLYSVFAEGTVVARHPRNDTTW